MKKISQPKQLVSRSNKDLFQQIKPTYFFENKLRKIKPYYFEYQTYAKQRWIGRTILNIFQSEFRDRPAEYYVSAIENDLISVNGQQCGLEHVIQNNDLIGHKLHRHEPPVSAEMIEILHNKNGILVVNKPGSIPVHPSGRYRFNSLVEILKNEFSFKHLSLINRLDRLTSGICILATNKETAEHLHELMFSRDYFHKEYIARVDGNFPDGITVCEEPLLTVAHKLGLVCVNPSGKDSKTIFEKLYGNGDYSIVKCKPITGRTHQIRVHLMHMGYPISNDPLYNNKIWNNIVHDDPLLRGKLIAAELLKCDTNLEEFVPNPKPEDIHCPDCSIIRIDPKKESMFIYLHAFKYSSKDWVFETSLPEWSRNDGGAFIQV